MRWPAMTSFAAATFSTAKPRQPHPDLAEQCRDRMIAIVLHTTNLATASAIRSPNGVVPGLRGNNLLLQTRQQQLPFGQVSPKLAISTRSSGRLIVATSMDCFSPSAPVFTNLTIQPTRSPPIRDQTRNYRFDARTPNLQAVPPDTGVSWINPTGLTASLISVPRFLNETAMS